MRTLCGFLIVLVFAACVQGAVPTDGKAPQPSPQPVAGASQPAPAAKAPRWVVDAKLVEATVLGDRLTDTVYPNCLAEYVYEVQKVVEGDAKAMPVRICVLHWVLTDFKPQKDVLDRKVGGAYRLTIETFSAHAKAYGQQRRESTVESLDSAPYLDVAQPAPKPEL